MNKGISETAFASQVEDLFKIHHWRWTHFRPARTAKGWRTPLTGDKGLPDYIAVRPPRLIFAELKDQYSKPSPEQEAWLEDLRKCQKTITLAPINLSKKALNAREIIKFPLLVLPETYLWRPSQFYEIAGILR